MPEYLVELYVSRTDAGPLAEWIETARRAAEELSRQGTRVLQLRSIFVPEDETCLLLYEASSADAVHEVARRAQLSFERLSAVVVSGEPGLEAKGDSR
ncbi:MAG TPA: hypothetical protein VLJ76_01185 [Gaiellaceae bacterium]|nr:hypothetical protein [Gaiellaceae bacterium]